MNFNGNLKLVGKDSEPKIRLPPSTKRCERPKGSNIDHISQNRGNGRPDTKLYDRENDFVPVER